MKYFKTIFTVAIIILLILSCSRKKNIYPYSPEMGSLTATETSTSVVVITHTFTSTPTWTITVTGTQPATWTFTNTFTSTATRGGGTFYSDTWLPMREFFKRTFGPYNLEHNPSAGNPYWDFNSWKPDVFFLELGTNDFSEQYPHIDETLYVNKYKAFLTDLRTWYPDAYICCIPPFKEGTPWDEPRAYIPLAVSQMADPKIHCVSLYGLLIHPTDYVTGDEYHPNAGGHTKIANYLYTNYIQPVVGW